MQIDIDQIIASGDKELESSAKARQQIDSILKNYITISTKIMEESQKQLEQIAAKEFKMAKNDYIFESERIAKGVIRGFVHAYLPQYDPYTIDITCNFAGDDIFITCDYSRAQTLKGVRKKDFNENSEDYFISPGEDMADDYSDLEAQDMFDEEDGTTYDSSLESDNSSEIEDVLDRLDETTMQDRKEASHFVSNNNLNGIFVAENKRYQGDLREVIQRAVSKAYNTIRTMDIKNKIFSRYDM